MMGVGVEGELKQLKVWEEKSQGLSWPCSSSSFSSRLPTDLVSTEPSAVHLQSMAQTCTFFSICISQTKDSLASH